MENDEIWGRGVTFAEIGAEDPIICMVTGFCNEFCANPVWANQSP